MTKKYEELTFTDDFMFCKILEQKKELCLELLELILGKKVGKLVEVNRQKPIEIIANGKGVRFDVFAEDGKTVYDVEMQNAKVDSLPKRIRYSQGMIDLQLLERGKHYHELNPSYVIYICKFNPYPETGRHKYTFKNLCCEDTKLEMGDEACKIILSSEGNVDDVSNKTKAFLDYVSKGKPTDVFTRKLECAVKEAIEHKRWRKEYMTLLEHYEQEREEGRKEERINTERERKRAEAAETRAEAAETKVKAAEERIKELEDLLKSCNKSASIDA